MDVNMPRDQNTGKSKGFAFIMYEDQRSTVLAVDNLSGAHVLGRTLKVDHVKSYRQPKVKNEEGELVEPEEQSFNAKPELIYGVCNDFFFSTCAITHFRRRCGLGIVRDLGTLNRSGGSNARLSYSTTT